MSRRSPDLDPAFDPVAERIADVGRHLRETRQQRGEDLYDVADYLRIKPSYLFALEEGDLASMPGRTYAMGFLRTYADHLGFDGAEVVRGLSSKTKGNDKLKVPAPAPENRLPSLTVVAAALLLASVAYGGWFAAQSGDAIFARIQAVPGEIGQYAASLFEDDAAAEAPAPVETLAAGNAVAPPASPPAAPARATPGADTPQAGLQAREVAANSTTATRATADSNADAPPSAAVAATAAIDPPSGARAGRTDDALASLVLDAEAERNAAQNRLEQDQRDESRPDRGTAGDLLAALQPGQTAAATSGDAAAPAPVTSETGRVVLLAREASWIQVQSPSRDFLRSTTLEPGQRFEIPNRGDLALWTGNAGGVEIWVDGQNIGVLGRSGAVMRDVSLDPDALIARR